MVVETDSCHVALVTEVQADHKFRNPAPMPPLSPLELAMGFVLDRHPKAFPRPLTPLDSDHPQYLTHGHKRRPRPVVP